MASIDLTAYNKVVIWAAVRKSSDAAFSVVAELSESSFTNIRTFRLAAPANAADTYQAGSSAGTFRSATVAGYAAPHAAVLVAQISVANLARLSVNGVAAPDVTESQGGSPSYGNYPLFIGKRAGTSAPLNGNIYALAILPCNTFTPDAVIKAMGRHYAAKAGIVI